MYRTTTDRQLSELEEVCTITADISRLRPLQLQGPKGSFQRYEYKFAIFFEGAKMKARLEWEEGVSSPFRASVCLTDVSFTGSEKARSSYGCSGFVTLGIIPWCSAVGCLWRNVEGLLIVLLGAKLLLIELYKMYMTPHRHIKWPRNPKAILDYSCIIVELNKVM
jgi:hypothetical protein